MLPDCVACTVQLPAPTIVTVFPATVQTDNVVDELKLTVSPDVAVALTANGGVPYTWFDSPLNVIVWLADVTVKL